MISGEALKETMRNHSPSVLPDMPKEEEHRLVVEKILADLEIMYRQREEAGKPLMLLSETQKLLELRWTLELPGGIAYTKRTAEYGCYVSQAIQVRFEDNPRVMCIGLSGGRGTGVELWAVQVKSLNQGWLPTDNKNHEAAIARAERVLSQVLATTRPRHWQNRDECGEYLRNLMLNYVLR